MIIKMSIINIVINNFINIINIINKHIYCILFFYKQQNQLF